MSIAVRDGGALGCSVAIDGRNKHLWHDTRPLYIQTPFYTSTAAEMHPSQCSSARERSTQAGCPSQPSSIGHSRGSACVLLRGGNLTNQQLDKLARATGVSRSSLN